MEKNGLFSQRIRLRHLHTFVAVAQQGTLGRAAETLNLSQPALSKTLNELEQLTGARLFDRGRLGRSLPSWANSSSRTPLKCWMRSIPQASPCTKRRANQ
jgi:hypothetical protein